MFNEILTGQATLEQRSNGPYRDPEVPNETRSCAKCAQAFTVKPTSTATTCMTCQLTAAAASAPTYSYDATPSVPGWVWRLGIGIVIAIAMFAYRYGKGSARTSELANFADAMCECTTEECARGVESEFDSWLSQHGDEEISDMNKSSLEAAATRYGECLGRVGY